MEKEYVLSISTNVLNNPSLIDLQNSDLRNGFFRVFTNANALREYANNKDKIFEIWIIDNDEIEPINLAATLKKDRNDNVICLISFSISGSLKSRAERAHIDALLTKKSFNERFFAIKHSINKEDLFLNKSFNQESSLNVNNIPKENYETQKNNAYILSVMSASGGAGKSSLSVMLAMLSHNAGLNTLLLDADLQYGDCANKLDAQNPISIDNLISDFQLINKVKFDIQKPSLISSLEHPEYAEKIIENFTGFLQKLSTLFDVIIINTGTFWNELQASLIENDTNSLFLVDQRPSSIKATEKALNLCSSCGIATSSIKFAINKCSKKSLFTSIDVSSSLKGVNVFEIYDGGFDVEEAMSTNNILSLIQEKNPFAVSSWAILEKFLPKMLLDKIYSSGQHVSNENRPKHQDITKSTLKIFRKKRA